MKAVVMRELMLLAFVSCAGCAQAPFVFNTRVDAISWTSVRIQWNTDIPASMAQVQYGSMSAAPPFPYATQFKTATAQAHGYRVGGLAPSTTYFYRACSTANSIQTCGPVGSFTTLAAPSTRFQDPTLPVEYIVPPTPTTFVNTYTVAPNCTDLQSKLDSAAAAPGSGHQLVLLPATKCLGSYTLKGRSSGATGWIVVRPNVTADKLPPEGVRVDNSWSPNMTTVSGNASGRSTFTTWPGARNWRLVGLKITHEPGIAGRLIEAGTETSEIIVDRCLITSVDTQTNLIGLNGSKSALVNSSVIGSKPQSLMVAVDFTYGQQITLANNYLNVPGITLFGQGGDGRVLTSDIVVRRNLLEWNPAFKDTMITRQQFEFKQVKRALLEGNTFRNQWAGGETGAFNYTWAFTPRFTDLATTKEDSQNEITDLTIRNNIAHDVPGGFQFHGAETGDIAGDVKGAGRWLISNLLMYNINGFYAKTGASARGSGWVFSGALEDVVISHVTVFDPRGGGPSVITWLEDRGAGIKITNSLLGANPQGPFVGVRWNSSEGGTTPAIASSTPLEIMKSVVHAAPNPDPTFEFSGNVLIPGVTDTSRPENYSDPSKAYPPAECVKYYSSLGGVCAGHSMATTASAVFNSLPNAVLALLPHSMATTANAVFDSVGFRDWRNADFALRPDSPFYAGSDGRPVGADMDAIAAAQGWVDQPTFSVASRGRSRVMTYKVSDPAMQCYVQWNDGGFKPDWPGSQQRQTRVPSGTTDWRLVCAGGSLPGARAGEAAVYGGTLVVGGDGRPALR